MPFVIAGKLRANKRRRSSSSLGAIASSALLLCMVSSPMARPAQLEAFNWWIDQNRSGRSSANLAKSRKIPIDTARRWVTEFNKRIAAEIEKSTAIKLTAYVEEYENVQRMATGSAVALAEVYESKADELRALAKTGAKVDLDELNKITSGMKSVYQLAEAASGADVAKSRAKLPTAERASGGLPALPDMSGIYEATGEEVTDSSEENDDSK